MGETTEEGTERATGMPQHTRILLGLVLGALLVAVLPERRPATAVSP